MTYKETLNNIQLIVFNIVVFFSYFLLIVSSLGLSENALIYLNKLSYYVKIYVCLFLIWRFNPLRTKYEFTDLDRNIAFSAGVFILSTTVLQKYVDNAKDRAQKLLLNIDDNL
jgi:hypothetical protein